MEWGPGGSINVCSADGKTYYYHLIDSQRKYIKEKNKVLIQELCQKDYNKKVLSAALKELKQLEKIKDKYAENLRFEDIYLSLPAARKKFVAPAYLPDEQFVKKWEAVEYLRKGFSEDAPEFYTEKGERVRSKTEILIANALKKWEVPYRYEYPLRLAGAGVIHPDFTVLNVRLRKEYYFEHMGMMDDENYRETALNRIVTYERNGIYPGDQLILTHETKKRPIDSRLIHDIIQHYFK